MESLVSLSFIIHYLICTNIYIKIWYFKSTCSDYVISQTCLYVMFCTDGNWKCCQIKKKLIIKHYPLGNYVALGTMEPEIQIWDLDVVNTIEPAYVLAGQKKKKKKKARFSIVIEPSFLYKR